MGEREQAADYWANRKLGAFSRPRPWSALLASAIDGLAVEEPRTIFEFGCNVGRHMAVMRERFPEATVTGMDIHLPAVHEARAHGLPVLLGDELSLSLYGDRVFDVAYTVSVIDHLPSPMQALVELDRIAQVLMLVEPWLGHDGRVDQVQGGKANPYLYSWDYEKRLPARTWRMLPFPLHDSGAGPHYRLHIGE